MANKIPDEFAIRSPEEEYELYVQKQIENARRFKEVDKVELYQEALQLGLKLLKDLR